MTTNNHPAHGPVSLDRLHQISKILSKAAAQSDGGNLGYAMADAVKVIDGAIAVFGVEPVEFLPDNLDRALTILGVALPISKEEFNLDAERWMQRLINRVIRLESELIPPAPAVPEWTNEECLEFLSIAFRHAEIKGDLELDDIRLGVKMVNDGRATMLQAGNSQVTPDCWCRTCRPVTMSDMRFVVCPDCGNKRCPHANDHRNACTGSNDPGQIGSAYPAAPQHEVKS
ncbi:hypothetical protein BTD16_003500 [Salmonella enterica subsp. enterica serovar Cerro]|nr:hypothetical protein [Salmonella enterica subsp. enterica serovar Cerro]